MLGLFLLGIGLVVGLYLLVQVFVSAEPRTLAKVLRWGGIILAVAVIGILLITGRLGIATALIAFVVPLFSHWRSLRHRMRAAMGPSGGQTSQVETLYLRMVLNHDTGAMSGEVLHGAFRGRSLDSLGLSALLGLLEECRGNDPQSAALLETWLDRAHPDWREKAEAANNARGHSGGGPMTVEEAREILGVPPGATPAQIKDAHRRLMMKVHPDHGGSTYLAAKINQAKDLLLKG
jgi:hypothetical protein